MWYLKEAAKKATQAAGSVYEYSKSFVVGETEPSDPVIDLLVDLLQEQLQIIPTKKLDQLVTYSYSMDNFEKISEWLVKKLSVFKYEESRIKECINMLTVVYYLIKHGASGFVDDFRTVLKMFQNYQKLTKRTLSQDTSEQREADNQLDIIISKARHIEILLTDKNKLLKEKQLAMLIKQKVATYSQKKDSKWQSKDTRKDVKSVPSKNSINKQVASAESSTESQPKITSDRKTGPKLTKPTNVEQNQKQKKEIEQKTQIADTKSKPRSTINDILEAYVWKYVDSLDDKLENISEKVMSKFDEYVDRIVQGQKPGQFELGDSDDEKDHDQMHSSAQQAGDEVLDKINKEIEGLDIKQEDLLDFEEEQVKDSSSKQQKPLEKVVQNQGLIVELI